MDAVTESAPSGPPAFFDEVRAVLHLSDVGVHQLGAIGSNEELQRWLSATANGDAGGDAHPTVRGLVDVLRQPARSVIIERFAGGMVVPLFIVWDAHMRCALIEPDGAGGTSIAASSLDLLQSALRQKLRLRSVAPASERPSMTSTVGVIDALMGAEPAVIEEVEELKQVLDGITFAWRATASAPNGEALRTMTIMQTGGAGLWRVDRPPREVAIDAETPITLHPESSQQVIERLGDVITGRQPRT